MDAEKLFNMEQDNLLKIRDEWRDLAKQMDADNARAARPLPLEPAQERTLKKRRLELRRDIRQWMQTRKGRNYATAKRNLEQLDRRYDAVRGEIEKLT